MIKLESSHEKELREINKRIDFISEKFDIPILINRINPFDEMNKRLSILENNIEEQTKIINEQAKLLVKLKKLLK